MVPFLETLVFTDTWLLVKAVAVGHTSAHCDKEHQVTGTHSAISMPTET